MGDGYPFWPFWEQVRSWWEIRDLPNVMLVHFADLKADLPGEIRRIADFLDIEIDEARWPAILEHCSFAYMKAHCRQGRAARRRLLGRRRRDLHPQGHQRALARRADAGRDARPTRRRRTPNSARLAPPGSPAIEGAFASLQLRRGRSRLGCATQRPPRRLDRCLSPLCYQQNPAPDERVPDVA